MTKNINDLRNSMFDALQLLKEGKITVQEAKAMSDIGQTIINSAKIEVDYIKAAGDGHSEFIQGPEELPDGVVRIWGNKLTG